MKPRLLKTALVFGDASVAKLKQISLSNNTIQRCILDILEDVKKQVVNEIKASPMFSFQVDELADVSSCAQLLVFVRYIRLSDIKKEFLFRSKLDMTTTSAYTMKKIKTFFEAAGLQWKDVCGVCTDEAPAMLRSWSSFVKKSKGTCSRSKGYTLFYS